MAVSGIIEIAVGTAAATPSPGFVDLYVDTADKRVKTVDETPTTRVLVDRDSAETLTNKTIASVATVPYVADATGAGAKKVASGGPVALVTGTKVVATGLATVTGFVAIPSGQPTGTGTASHQILAATSITTGAVTVTAYSVSSVTGATVAANTSTGSFYWFAMGT